MTLKEHIMRTQTSTPSTPSTPTIPQAALDDLHLRLGRAIWPRRAAGAAVPGFDTEKLRPLVEYWRDGFDWRAVEARLERFGQLTTTTADGRRLHTLHARGGSRMPARWICSSQPPRMRTRRWCTRAIRTTLLAWTAWSGSSQSDQPQAA